MRSCSAGHDASHDQPRHRLSRHPPALRRARAGFRTMPASTRIAVKIKTPAGFNFSHTVVSHGWYHLAPFRWDRARETLHRIELLDGQPVALAITDRNGALQVKGAKDSNELRAKLTRMFQLDLDLS